MTKKTRHKHLAVSAQRRLEEKLRRQRMVRGILIGVGVVAALALVGGAIALTGGDKNSTAADSPSPHVAVDKWPDSKTGPCQKIPPPQRDQPPQMPGPYPVSIDKDKTYTATLETNCGNIVVTMDPKAAPATVNNFVQLAKGGWYDPMYFHRIANEIDIIQVGDPYCAGNSAPPCGSGGPGYTFPDELTGKEKYTTGTVAMANSGPDTNGSQIFIVTGKAGSQLPPSYTIFGQVTKGLDVAQAIQDTPVSEKGEPLDQVWLLSVKIDESK